MDFTKKELYEIEKIMDMQAGVLQEQMARVANSLHTISKDKADKWMDKTFDSYVRSYDMFRTISAKCEKNREDKKVI